MTRVPNWILPKNSRRETSSIIWIGPVVHWASALLAALLLCLAFLAIATAALAQEIAAFNAASPATRQAIRDSRAMRQEIGTDRVNKALPSTPNPFDRFDIAPNADLTKRKHGTQIPQTREQLERARPLPTPPATPAPNYFDRFDGQPPAPKRSSTPQARPDTSRSDLEDAWPRGQRSVAPPYNAEWEKLSRTPHPDCTAQVDGSLSTDDANRLCPDLLAERSRKHQQEEITFALTSLASAIALLPAGRCVRYILANQ